MKAFAILMLAVVVVTEASLRDAIRQQFSAFRAKYQKSFSSLGEEAKRLRIFAQNVRAIEEHNKRFFAGKETFKMGINRFTDLLESEFLNDIVHKLNPEELNNTVEYTFSTASNVHSLPSHVDWRAAGGVNRVKNQGSCASCWAFSAVGCLESHHLLYTRQRASFSEQNLVDCTNGEPYQNYGCRGGWPIRAFNYIRDNGGINTEQSYPYEAQDGACRFNPNTVGTRISAVISIESGNEQALATAVATKGPISACIDAHHFQHYQGGIINDPNCPTESNHCVIVDGYGTDPQGGDYWLVRNTWGTDWGEGGYVRMARNRGNQCLIASYATYPIIQH